MIRFHLKKAFFDGWDHVLPLMIINLLYLAVPGALVLVYIGNPVNSVPGIIALLAALFVSVTLIPGICGISFSQMDALRLVLIRYNYTENNPGAVRRNLDWKTVFAEEAEQLGR